MTVPVWEIALVRVQDLQPGMVARWYEPGQMRGAGTWKTVARVALPIAPLVDHGDFAVHPAEWVSVFAANDERIGYWCQPDDLYEVQREVVARTTPSRETP